MAITDVSLTSGMRNNLLQLQATSKSIATTQERLSTGRQVNSALDNPTNFFASQAALNRAADFGARKDSMGEAIQNVKAADAGITAITSLIAAAKGLTEAALGTTSTTDRNAFALQYDALKTQITQLSSDSGYRGTNLLTGDNLTVNFNEDATSKLTVTGFSSTATGLSIGTAVTDWSVAGTSVIQGDQDKLKVANDELRTQSKSLAGSLNIITTRQTFTDSMISTLQTGSDNLTLADMNKEGANMLMLNTRNSLGTTALSLSSQAAQSVLRLF
jgi:flagellin-like hook-associated protein FlgL